MGIVKNSVILYKSGNPLHLSYFKLNGVSIPLDSFQPLHSRGLKSAVIESFSGFTLISAQSI